MDICVRKPLRLTAVFPVMSVNPTRERVPMFSGKGEKKKVQSLVTFSVLALRSTKYLPKKTYQRPLTVTCHPLPVIPEG